MPRQTLGAAETHGADCDGQMASCATAVIQLDCVNKSAHADQLLHLLRIELRTSRLLNGCSTNGASRCPL